MNLDFPLEKADKISSKSAALPGAATREVRVGPAGWSYTDWAGYVYPTRRAKGFHEATYLAQFFDTIEINTSFYGPMRRGSHEVVAGACIGKSAIFVHGEIVAEVYARSGFDARGRTDGA